MSDPRTALDLAYALGREVIGIEHWNQSVGLAGVFSPRTINPLRDRLAVIPVDAVQQIIDLHTEVEQLKDQVEFWASESGQAP